MIPKNSLKMELTAMSLYKSCNDYFPDTDWHRN